MLEQNKAVVRRQWEEVINQKKLHTLDKVCAEDYVLHAVDTGETSDREGFKRLATLFHTAFPDLHGSIDNMVAKDDKVAFLITLTGTHQGDYMGISPTGRQIELTGLGMCRLSSGRIVEQWNQVDILEITRQLGAAAQR